MIWVEAVDRQTGVVYAVSPVRRISASDTAITFGLNLPAVTRSKRVRMQVRTAGIGLSNTLRLSAINRVEMPEQLQGRSAGQSSNTALNSRIEEAKAAIPTEFGLNQNYPNPFNPSTVIRYALPKASDVKIVVFDILGRVVASLVNERKSAGYYELPFNAASLASGTYFYRIQAGEFVQTKKMLLLK